MNAVLNFVASVLGAVLRLALWALAAVLALGLLALALVLLLLGAVWALLRGRRPTAPVFVGRVHRFTTERVWPGAAGRAAAADVSTEEVVDVQVREVQDDPAVRLKGPPGP